MTNRVIWVLIAIAAAVGAALFIVPMIQRAADNETEHSIAPEFGSVVSVENPRFVMPPRAGQSAALYFDVTNKGERSVQLVDVQVRGAAETKMTDVERPAPLGVATIRIDPGQTMRFGPGQQYLVASSYDGTVVPGAQVDVTLTFGNAQKLSFTAPVLLENPHTNSEGPLE